MTNSYCLTEVEYLSGERLVIVDTSGKWEDGAAHIIGKPVEVVR